MTDTRFAFGANWARFLERLTPERIALAERALTDWLGDISGRAFLDIGSGSGLHSLAARNLGAHIVSFDYDHRSVACTTELRRRYHPDDPYWRVERGDALDSAYLRSLGTFDVVCSWGVLHHTGRMWDALEKATIPLAPNGRLYLAIYNRVPHHRALLAMKWTHTHIPPLRWPLVGAYAATHALPEIAAAIYRRRPPLGYFRDYALTSRGMSWWTDVIDWVGGYPYESAPVDEVTDFFQRLGLALVRAQPTAGAPLPFTTRTIAGHGCNEFLFRR